MSRRDDDDGDAMPGQDSFIDVICNMVGILIVLVMVLGVRASQGPSEAAIERAMAAAKDGAVNATVVSASTTPAAAVEAKKKEQLQATIRDAFAIRDELTSTVTQAVNLNQQSQLVDAQREALSVVQAQAQQEIEERRSRLDDTQKTAFDVQRRIVDARIKLHELTAERLSLDAPTTEVEEIECVPTPLAKTVSGEELHVRLKHGQLAVVPVDELLEEVKASGVDHMRTSLRNRDEAVDAFGPMNGFRLRLSVQRYEEEGQSGVAGVAVKRSGVVLQGVFLPTTDDIGQAIEQALLPDSPFMKAMRSRRSNTMTVTAWTYGDSYGALRSLKKAMWEAGIPLAVRPLDVGQPIIFSTLGTHSVAE